MTRRLIGCLMLGLALRVSALDGVSDQVPIQAFSRAPEFMTPKLSPDGRYIAFIVPSEKKSTLAVMRVSDQVIVGSFKMDEDNHVADFWWVSDTRIIASLATQLGSLDSPTMTGELVAFDANGGDPRYLYGYRKIPQGVKYKDSEQWGAATMLDPMIDDSDQALISLRSYAHWKDGHAPICRINVRSGELTLVDRSPFRGGGDVLVDTSGKARYAMGYDGVRLEVWQRLEGEENWHPLAAEGLASGTVEPLQFARDGRSVFLSAAGAGTRRCLVQQSLEHEERRELACNPDVDLESVIPSFDPSGDPIAAVFQPGKPQITVLDDGSRSAKLLQWLMTAFPGKLVSPESMTRDGYLALVRVDDDRTPGDYYLFDARTQKATYWRGLRQWLDPALMPERRPIMVKARDGTLLHGYLTLPQGIEPKRLPLVVNPHGGPFHVRDDWRFDIDAAMLASRGYAVLQINFRGSKGYGADFAKAGYKAWGTSMIDDITDATRWTVAQGYADEARMCIYGASYGGFAALMSAVREPDLYRCVVGYAGAYDLPLLQKDSDISESDSGRHFFSEGVAGSDEELRAQSPITYLDRLKAPMLIVHGEEDARTPFTQAKALRKAMRAGDHSYEWMTRAGEGHGFQKTKNIQAFNETLLNFLDKYIGPSSQRSR